ncbi:MAG: hypothetical protein R6W78_15685 [Bacteroidales bacterium]
MKTRTLIFPVTAIVLLFYNCSMRTFYLSAVPEGTLIQHAGYFTAGESTIQEIPYTLAFIGKKDSSYFSAMKRGYFEDTIWVKKNSPEKVCFNLERREGIAESSIYKELMNDAELTVFQPVVDVILHKGVGNLDKYEKSDELSSEVQHQLSEIVKNEFEKETSGSKLHFIADTFSDEAFRVSGKAIHSLLSFKPSLLKYYGIPPAVNCRELLSNPAQVTVNDNTLWVVIYCKTVKPTAGRIIGNAAATIGSGAVQGYQQAMYGYSTIMYDPAAYALDNSTLMMAYYIHPGSGEVIDIKQVTYPFDIINQKYQEKIVAELPEFIYNAGTH